MTGLPSVALLTDHYELTMVAAALRDGTAGRRVRLRGVRPPAAARPPLRRGRRHRPARRGARRASGSARPSSTSCARPRSSTTSTVAWLADYRFAGDIDGYAEGELFFPGSPILTVTGTFAECVVLETLVLSVLNHDCAIAAAAARMVTAARGRPLIEMGSRRTHEEAAVAAARAAYLAGFASTSNLEAGRRYGVPTTGTAAHAFTLLHDDEPAAFASQVAALGKQTTLLVDTYDISQGIRNAIAVAGPGPAARSGSTPATCRCSPPSPANCSTRSARSTRKIVVSGDLDEYAIAALAAEPVDVYGAGTAVVTGSGAPTAGLVYKLVEVDGRPVVKRSENKATIGGRKTAVRRHKPTGTATEEVVVSQGAPAGRSRTTGPCSGRSCAAASRCRPAHPGRVARAPAAVPDLDPVGGAEALRRRPGHPGHRHPGSSHDPRTDHRGRAERLLRGRLAGGDRRRRGRRRHLGRAGAPEPTGRVGPRGRDQGPPRRPGRPLRRPAGLRRHPGRRTASPAPPGPTSTPRWTPTGSRRSSTKGEHAAAYSGFEGHAGGIGLAAWLRMRDVTEVDIVGIATDHCVRATALDAVREGFATTVLLDLTAGVAARRPTRALAELRAAGVTLAGSATRHLIADELRRVDLESSERP